MFKCVCVCVLEGEDYNVLVVGECWMLILDFDELWMFSIFISMVLVFLVSFVGLCSMYCCDGFGVELVVVMDLFKLVVLVDG